MPAQLFILLHWRRQLRVFLHNLELLNKQYQPDAIHDLRVAVKKLRAYLKLLKVLDKKADYSKEFEETERLFDVMGKHRDIEIGIQLLQKFEEKNQVSYALFRDHLEKALQQSGAWIQPALANFDVETNKELTGQLQQQLKNADQAKLATRVEAIIEKEYRKSEKHMAALDHDTHQVRKLFKDIVYQAEICPKEPLPGDIPLSKIKKALDRLGDWQDHEMLHQKIKHFRKDFIPSTREEFGVLKELEKNIAGKKQNLLRSCEKIFNRR